MARDKLNFKAKIKDNHIHFFGPLKHFPDNLTSTFCHSGRGRISVHIVQCRQAPRDVFIAIDGQLQ